jgi:hypothetical protein
VSRKTAIIPAAPFPLPPLETIIGYHIPTPSPEPEIFELPRLNPAKRKRPNSHRPSLPRTHRADSDEPVLLSEAPGWLRQPTATPGGSTTSAFIDPSKIVFDPLAQAPPLGATCKIVRYPGKGLGLQATRTIKRGEEVIRETPFSPLTILSPGLTSTNVAGSSHPVNKPCSCLSPALSRTSQTVG